jgi:uncharacterized membrane protein YfcA
MEIVIGFIIAALIGLTGIGGGTITAPVLIIFLGMPAADAVGTSLVFATIIKLLVVPVYFSRKQIDFGIAGWMLIGGLPGVVLGGLLLNKLASSDMHRWLYLLLGVSIVVAALLNIYRLLTPPSARGAARPKLLALLMLPVGAETGFSSAGSGALGSLALLGLTQLSAAEVVGTGVFFGLMISVVGGGIQILSGHFVAATLIKLLIGGVIGAFAGTTLALKIPSKPLKWGLAVWLAALGVQLFFKGFA